MNRQQRRHAERRAAKRMSPAPPGATLEAALERGIAAHRAGRLEDADVHYRRVLDARPDHAQALHLRGDLSLTQGRLDEAEDAYRRLLALRPGRADVWHSLGLARQNDGRPEAAVEAYGRAIRIDPRHAESHNNMGVALHQIGRPADAAASYRRAVALDPGYTAAFANLGITLKVLGDYEGAVASFDRAIAILPHYPIARYSRAILNLSLGRFAAAWPDYLWRHGIDRAEVPLPTRPLLGDLAGRRFRVQRDQGLGDEIFFMRHLRILAAEGAVVSYEPHPKIAGMIGRLPFISRVLEAGEADEEAEANIAIGDLPFLLSAQHGAAPPPPVAVAPDPARVAALEGRLASSGPPPRIGVTWRAGSPGPETLDKQVPLEGLARALAPTRATVVALQRNPGPGEVDALSRALGRPVADLTAINDDLEDILALMTLIDDYVAVSNTNLHLRAGHGKCCRVLVPNPPEFRWMTSGAESPWFPGYTVYRQRVDGGWDDALEALASGLQSNPA